MNKECKINKLPANGAKNLAGFLAFQSVSKLRNRSKTRSLSEVEGRICVHRHINNFAGEQSRDTTFEKCPRQLIGKYLDRRNMTFVETVFF
jgi:hypothetical protein